MLGLGRRLLQLHWLSVRCRNLYLVEEAGAPCRESQSSHGKVEDPSLEVVAVGTEMVELQVAVHIPPSKTRTHNLAVPQRALGTSQWAQVHAVVDGHCCSTDYSVDEDVLVQSPALRL